MIDSCTSPGAFCESFVSARVQARLFLDGAASQQHLVAASAGGGTEVFASQGVAQFRQIGIKTAASNYVLRFQAKGLVFPSKVFERLIAASTLPLTVVSSAPAGISALSARLAAVDASVLQEAAQIRVVDKFGNLVSSDCYTSCGETLPASCSSSLARCAADSQVLPPFINDMFIIYLICLLSV